MTLYQGLSAMLSLRSVATESRRVGVEGPVFEEAVREVSRFAARANDNERFTAEPGTRRDLHRLDDLVGKMADQLRPLACIAAVTKHHAQTRAHAKDLPQRVSD